MVSHHIIVQIFKVIFRIKGSLTGRSDSSSGENALLSNYHAPSGTTVEAV